jgi:hypothetical protein
MVALHSVACMDVEHTSSVADELHNHAFPHWRQIEHHTRVPLGPNLQSATLSWIFSVTNIVWHAQYSS